MRVEILTIGDELLDGRVTDTNTVRLAQALGAVGVHLQQRTSVTDDIDAIVREARHCAARGTQICVVSGGLGPTADDLTAAAFAQLLGVELVRDAAEEKKLRERLSRRGREVSANQLRQADRPRGAELLPNAHGTAPGFAVTYAGCRFVAMPGIPLEFDPMVQGAIIAPLLQQAPLARRALYCFGLIEAEVDRRLGALSQDFAQVRLQFQVKFPEIHVTMHAPADQGAALDGAAAAAAAALGDHVYATAPASPGLPATTLALCRQHGATVALAESCTGGLVADLITDVPGCSEVFRLGLVTYSNAAKGAQLQVDPDTLRTHGAVSEAVVQQMAAAARRHGEATFGIGISGIAGPGGGSPEKPVGTVWIGLAGPHGITTQQLKLPFERRANKVVSAYTALNMLRQQLLSPTKDARL